jgi:hypothetical protein
VAERTLTEAIGDAILAAVEWGWPHVRVQARAVLERVADAVRPSPPISLVSLDGREVLTGIVVLDRGQVIAFLGTREPAASRGPPLPQYPHAFDDEPLGDRLVRPYGR